MTTSAFNLETRTLAQPDLPARPFHTRRAMVRSACARSLSSEDALKALALWDRTKDQSPARFARRCRKELSLSPDAAKRLCRSLSQLSPDNSRGLDKHFAARLGELLMSVWRLRSGLNTHAATLSPKARKLLLDWAAADTPKLDVPSLDACERQEIMDCIEQWLESCVGPGATRAMLERTR